MLRSFYKCNEVCSKTKFCCRFTNAMKEEVTIL